MGDWYDKLSESFRETATETLAKVDVSDPNVKCFTKRQIKRISNNYSTVLGKGGFSVVYKGMTDDGHPVAVKQYNWKTQKKEFTKEVIIQSQFSHKNIVRLLGCCLETDAPTLVTEFIPNGDLSDLLHGGDIDDRVPISLDTRLQIALDVAEALVYMHCSQTRPVLHGDVKPSNILVGDKHMAKLCDFGISRLLCMDSENKGIHEKKVCLAEIFAQASKKGKMHELFDVDIANVENVELIEGVGCLALECTKFEVEERPEMKQVLEKKMKRKET